MSETTEKAITDTATAPAPDALLEMAEQENAILTNMERTANNPARIVRISFEEGNHVVCPRCGSLVNAGSRTFESQGVADVWAMHNCECGQAASEEHPKFGYCRYCGGGVMLPAKLAAMGGMAPDEWATRHCKCDRARRYKDAIDGEQHRKDNIEAGVTKVNEIFAPAEYATSSVSAPALSTLRTAVGLVYDNFVVQFTAKLTHNITATIKKNAKGNLSIERKDTTAEKAEI